MIDMHTKMAMTNLLELDFCKTKLCEEVNACLEMDHAVLHYPREAQQQHAQLPVLQSQLLSTLKLAFHLCLPVNGWESSGNCSP